MTLNTAFKLGGAAILAAFAIIAMTVHAQASTRQEIKDLVISEAENSRVPTSLALAVAKVESDFNAKALSTAGARGVMQIMPKTAKGEFGVEADELWDARLNIQLGIEYLAKLYRQYEGRWELALSHYNGGTLQGRGRQAEPHSYTRDYVSSVMRWRGRYAHLDQETGFPERQGRIWQVAGNDRYDEEEEDWVPGRRKFRRKRGKKSWSEYNRFSHDPQRRYGKCYADRRDGLFGGSRIRTSWWGDDFNDYPRNRRNNSWRYNRSDRWGTGGLRDRLRRSRHDLDDFASNARRWRG